MKKSNIILAALKNGCVIFTFIVTTAYITGTLLASENKAFIPTLKWVLLFLAFSVTEAFANLLLKSEKAKTSLKLFTHFIASAALYFVLVVLCGGFITSGSQTLIAMSLFIAVYLIFALVFSITSTSKKKKKNKKEKYSSMFS